MNTQEILIGLSNAAWLIGGSVAILGVFVLGSGGMIWLWLQIGKWLARYIYRASGEFREAFQAVNGKVISIKDGKKAKA